LPSKDLYEFEGDLKIRDGDDVQEYPLSEKQLLLKGSKLMNTGWVVGCVVYTGLDTKLMQNQNKGRHKQSRLEVECNKTVLRMFIFHVVASIALAWSTIQWEARNSESTGSLIRAYYLYHHNQSLENKPDFVTFIKSFLTILCLNSTFIPISLLVAIEVVKVCQAWFISVDVEMLDAIYEEGEDTTFQMCKVNNSCLNEELG